MTRMGEDKKVCHWGISHMLMAHASTLIKNYRISYMQVLKTKWDASRQKANQAMLYQGKMGYLKAIRLSTQQTLLLILIPIALE